MDESERIELKNEWETCHYFNLPKQIYQIENETDENFCNCFHYTSLETFWNMAESDLMFARNVCFSNDSEEYKLGKKIIDNILPSSNDEVQDLYMICFCLERDKLSQWREYAKNGVCLGFDVSGEDYYTILNNKKTEKNNESVTTLTGYERYGVPAHGGCIEQKGVYRYAKLLKVFYVEEADGCINKKFKYIDEMLTSSELPKDKYLHHMIPYIKHKGFHEENESRLVFMIDSRESEYQVNYLNESGVKKPYIKVEFGEIEEKKGDKCEIIFDHIEGIERKLKDSIVDLQDKYSVSISTKSVVTHVNGQIIIGCCNKQKEIFEKIDGIVSKWNAKHEDSKIKIWCKGHLPIREIIVGPSQNKKEVKESIQHFLKNVYWLKYVDVKCTDIPYREKRDG